MENKSLITRMLCTLSVYIHINNTEFNSVKSLLQNKIESIRGKSELTTPNFSQSNIIIQPTRRIFSSNMLEAR